MCPACVSSAAIVAGTVMSTGGLTAFLMKIFCPNKNAKKSDPVNDHERRNYNGSSDE
jgi:hypothetical protein